LQANATATITIVLTPTPFSIGGSAKFNGGAVIARGQNNITSPQVIVPAVMSDFSIMVNPASVAVPQAGDTAPYQVQVTPNPVYGANIALTCSGLPAASTCAFSTPTVTLASQSPAAPTLNITTTARPVTLPALSIFSLRFLGVWLPVPGLALIGMFGSGRRRRRIIGILLFCAVFLLLALQPACSSKSTQPPVSGTPAGTYSITVTGTSGSDTKNYGISLVVP
jgi:hypothetical protein